MSEEPMPGRTRRITWRRLDAPGEEDALLYPSKGTWHLSGRVSTSFGDRPVRIRYRIACSPAWGFRLGLLQMDEARTRRRLSARLDGDRGWTVSGRPRPDLEGCTDLDLSITPSTNTIPIRRLGLGVGESADVTAAWVRFPELTVEPLLQRYTRLGANRFRYEGLGSGFTADLETDDDGLVVAYPHLWARA